MNFKSDRHCGFTIIELVIVIVIIGIVTAVSAPRFFKLQSFEERGYYDEIMSAIRYAHKAAMATGCDYKVSVTSAGYEIRKRRDCSSGVFDLFNHPATNSPNGYNENTPSGIGITGNLDFYYDNNGQPNDFSDNPINKTTISIGSRNITIEAYTGFAHS